jgi:hypothetical protein
MDLAQLFIVDLGWVFFAAWAAVLTTVAAIAFGRDILPFGTSKGRNDRR